jgi:hypothetical protein
MRLVGILSAACFAAIVLAQPADREIPVVTVCDVLSDLARYNGKTIILVGLQWGTDEGAWIDAKCERKLVTNGFTWPDSISDVYFAGTTAPPPELPSGFKWKWKLVAAKLRELKQTTKRQHGEQWAALYGRLEANVPPKTFIDPKRESGGLRVRATSMVLPRRSSFLKTVARTEPSTRAGVRYNV